MSTRLDQTRPVRPGEELDLAKLGAYLDAQLGDSAPLHVEQFPGGHSNLTYLVRRGDRDLVLRRPPHGAKIKSAHDMGREHRVLSRLAPVFGKAPRPVLFCADPAILGAEFYLMEPVRGVILRRDVPPGRELGPDMARRLSEVLVDTLAELHGVDYQAAGLGELGRPAGYVERQVTGWTRRYANAQTDDLPDMDEAARWLAGNLPADTSAALIHNDVKFDNVVLDPADLTRVIGILDWEMCTIGDPLMDLGTTLSYWVEAGDPPILHQARFGPTHLSGMLTRAQVVERYAGASGRDTSNMLFYYAYGLFKTAVVAQQIYQRYQQGLTRDPRFAQMIHGVRALASHCRSVLERGTL